MLPLGVFKLNHVFLFFTYLYAYYVYWYRFYITYLKLKKKKLLELKNILYVQLMQKFKIVYGLEINDSIWNCIFHRWILRILGGFWVPSGCFPRRISLSTTLVTSIG